MISFVQTVLVIRGWGEGEGMLFICKCQDELWLKFIDKSGLFSKLIMFALFKSQTCKQ